MQAIEFNATAYHHTIQIPDTIPDGATFRVLLLLDNEVVTPANNTDVKALLANLTEGLTEQDLQRSDELATEITTWDI
jgi:hypothetical protein